MIDRTGMTIDAYLKQAGITSKFSASAKTAFPPEGKSATRFNAILRAARTADEAIIEDGSEKATIVDYLKACTKESEIPAPFDRSTVRGEAPAGITRSFSRDSGYRTSVDGQTAETAVAKKTAQGRAGKPINPDPPSTIHQSIRAAAKKYNLSESLIKSVIEAESNFRADAISPAGAQGLMQLMPATARELGVTDPFDIEQNIDAGARYLRKMLNRFNGDTRLALTAYNAGPGTVARYNGDVPYEETRNYVQRVLSSMRALKDSNG